MAKPLLDDELWALIEPLIPRHKPRRFRYPGRKPLDHRKVLTGILFVLRTGIQWEYLPRELGCGSGMTCWNHLHEWQEAGVWQKIHELLLAKLQGADKLDWSRAIVDSSSVRAIFGGQDRAKPHGPPQDRLEAPCGHGCPRRPACSDPDRGQRPRRHAADTARRRNPSRAGEAGPPTSAARQAPGGPCLRLAAAPQRAELQEAIKMFVISISWLDRLRRVHHFCEE